MLVHVCLSVHGRSPHRPGKFVRHGQEKGEKEGPTRVRTGDPLHPKQVSYH